MLNMLRLDKEGGSKLSHIMPTKLLAISAFVASFLALTLVDQIHPLLVVLLPFYVMIMKGVDVDLFSCSILTIVCFVNSLVVSFPFKFIAGKYYYMTIYMPIVIVFYKEPHDAPSSLFLLLQQVFWDNPLMIWIHLMCYLKLRALQVRTLLSLDV